MLKLQGERIYLATLERKDCRKLYEDFEYDFDHLTERLNIGHSIEGGDNWFDEIQKLQGKQHIRLGIFLNDGTVIGDVALQDIDHWNRSCSVGIGIAKIKNRRCGYGKEAIRLIVDYGFLNVGLERIVAQTSAPNIASQKSFERLGFTLEGTMRQAEYFGGKRYDQLHYGMLAEEWSQIKDEK